MRTPRFIDEKEGGMGCYANRFRIALRILQRALRVTFLHTEDVVHRAKRSITKMKT